MRKSDKESGVRSKERREVRINREEEEEEEV